jgi:allantoinase
MSDGATGHSYYTREPIVQRSQLAWPNGAQAACAIVISAEYYEMQPLANAFIPPNVPGGFGKGPYPDFRNYSARAYGNRVGIFRIFEALDRHSITASVAVDALTVKLCPQLFPHILKRDFEVIAHGESLTRVISSQMTETEERNYIRSSLQTIAAVTGTTPVGWHGPEYGESARTPALLAESGVKYVLDWPNDDQPIVMTTPKGSIISIPMLIDLDDVYAQFHRKISIARWRLCVEDAFAQIIADGEDGIPRLLVINLHPWLSGHPFRIAHVDTLLETLSRLKDSVWLATTGEIAAWWASQGDALGHRSEGARV